MGVMDQKDEKGGVDMKNVEKLIKGKIPCAETGIEIKKSICHICNPSTYCGLDLYVKDGEIIKVQGMAEHTNSGGTLCPKGAATRQYVYSDDRLRRPMKRVGEKGSGRFEEISWEEAYGIIADRLNRLKKEEGPERAAFYVGYEKWIRPFVQRMAYAYGSPNFCSESCTCFKAMYMAWRLTYGSLVVADGGNAECLLAWSCNPFHSYTPGAAGMLGFKEAGKKLIVVDPRLSPMASHADIHLQLRPGTDGALALGMTNAIIEEGLYDKDFANNYMHGFEEYREYVQEFPPKRAAEITGVPEEKILEAARLYAGTKPAALMTSSSPVVHHTNGLQNYRAVMLLPALTGNIEVKGGNLLWELAGLETAAGFRSRTKEYMAPPKAWSEFAPRIGEKEFPVWMAITDDAHGIKLFDQILKEDPYPVKQLVSFGLNHRMWPDPERAIEALKKLDFFVNVEIFHTEACNYADIVLPVCTSVERSELVSYGDGFTWYTSPAITPLYESRSDTDVIFELAKRLDIEDDLMKQGYEANLDWILGPSGKSLDEIKKSPCGVMFEQPPLQYKRYEKGGFTTPSGKVECVSEVIRKLQPSCSPLPVYEPSRMSREAQPELAKEYPFLLNTGSRLPMFQHSRTYRVPWLRNLRPTPSADISREDAAALGIEEGDWIRISTPKADGFSREDAAGLGQEEGDQARVRAPGTGGINLEDAAAQRPEEGDQAWVRAPKASITVRAHISDMIQKGVVSVYHGHPDADVNTLIDADYLDPISGFPGFKSLLCKIEKVEGGSAGVSEAKAAGEGGSTGSAGAASAEPGTLDCFVAKAPRNDDIERSWAQSSAAPDGAIAPGPAQGDRSAEPGAAPGDRSAEPGAFPSDRSAEHGAAPNDAIESDPERCSGCYTCVVACMDQNNIDAEDSGVCGLFGTDPAPSIMKTLGWCDGCEARVEHGLPPACVGVCPTKAMKQRY